MAETLGSPVSFDSTDVPTLALRVAERTGSGDWAVLIVAPGQESATAAELVEALREIGDEPVASVTVTSADEVFEQVQGSRVSVISGLSDVAEAGWTRLDRQRSRLLSEGNTILVITRDGMDRLARFAPNLQSWIGPSVWIIDTEIPELSDGEKAARLGALRRWSEMSDSEVIALAEKGELPGDPEYVEWLVLIDRGDLIARD